MRLQKLRPSLWSLQLKQRSRVCFLSTVTPSFFYDVRKQQQFNFSSITTSSRLPVQAISRFGITLHTTDGWSNHRRGLTTASTTSDRVFEDDGKPMDKLRLYRYLQLKTFTKEELEQVYDRMCTYQRGVSSEFSDLQLSQVAAFFGQRIDELEQERNGNSPISLLDDKDGSTRTLYAQLESKRFYRVFHPKATISTTNNTDDPLIISRDEFVEKLIATATAVDVQRIWPITFSILLVGTSVGIVTPAMPFVVSNLGLTPGQYGTVVSAFALSKMAGNIPSAILVERHGRKVSGYQVLCVCTRTLCG